MTFTPTTDAQRLHGQVRSTYLVLDLLHRAQRDNLPPATWTVADAGGTLLIRCHTRSAWTAWAAATAVDQIRPEVSHGDCTHLHAAGDVASNTGGSIRVAVIADLDDLDEPIPARIEAAR